jgi:hypothetical protein
MYYESDLLKPEAGTNTRIRKKTDVCSVGFDDKAAVDSAYLRVQTDRKRGITAYFHLLQSSEL